MAPKSNKRKAPVSSLDKKWVPRKKDTNIYDSDDSDDDDDPIVEVKKRVRSVVCDSKFAGQCCEKHKGAKQGVPCAGCGKCFYQSNFIDGSRCQRCFDAHKYANGGVYPVGKSAKDIAADYTKQRRPLLLASSADLEKDDKRESDDDIISDSDDVLNVSDEEDNKKA